MQLLEERGREITKLKEVLEEKEESINTLNQKLDFFGARFDLGTIASSSPSAKTRPHSYSAGRYEKNKKITQTKDLFSSLFIEVFSHFESKRAFLEYLNPSDLVSFQVVCKFSRTLIQTDDFYLSYLARFHKQQYQRLSNTINDKLCSPTY
jgi:hypothetical protein